jgi:hypothetical protein
MFAPVQPALCWSWLQLALNADVFIVPELVTQDLRIAC